MQTSGNGELTHVASWRQRWATRTVICLFLALHSSMIAWQAGHWSPTSNEPAHMVAGLTHWSHGSFSLYKVNPPLVRSVAVIPLAKSTPGIWTPDFDAPGNRSEYSVGREFVRECGPESQRYFRAARWACIPFAICGALVCWRWSRELYGQSAGLLALGLWCFSPNVLAYGALITPDAAAASLGTAAAFAFWKWLNTTTSAKALLGGAVLGLAELTKSTWVILFLLWPLLWTVWKGWPRVFARIARPIHKEDGQAPEYHRWKPGQMVVILLIGLHILNLGYGFEGSFTRLGRFPFISNALGGEQPSESVAIVPRNQFAGSWLGAIPVPLPKNYMLGIDMQRADFEGRMWSYLRGEWRFGGWWYYYGYTLLIKVPLGTWLLFCLAAGVTIFGRGYRAAWRDELMLLVPPTVVLVLVSSQTGFNHHVRYVLPILPFLFIWISKVARSFQHRARKIVAVTTIGFCWVVVSSVSCFPHHLSYFNELVGGPTGGHYHLGHSNTDWGQDLIYLRKWMERDPDVTDLCLALDMGLIDPMQWGVRNDGLPPYGLPEQGWHAVSVNQIHSMDHHFEYFLDFQPVAMAGYSIYIYHITFEQANEWRRDHGMPELPAACEQLHEIPESV